MTRLKLSALATWLHNRRSYFAIILVVNLLILGIWSSDLFMATRLRFADLYFVDAAPQDTIVLVALDDTSLERYGSTPAEWSRNVFADFLTIMSETSARVVALDLLFSGTDDADTQFLEAIEQLRSNTTRTQLVVAGAGVGQPLPNVDQAANLHFSTDLPLIDSLDQRVDYIGLTNTFADVDGIVRRQPSLVTIGDSLNPQLSFSIATLFAYLRIPSSVAPDIITIEQDHITLPGERHLQTDERGFWQQNYFGSPNQHFSQQTVSFVDVLDGNIDLEQFDDAMVLVGLLNTTSNLDSYAVPTSSSTLMAGVEIQAHAVLSILEDVTLQPLSSSATILLITVAIWLVAMTIAQPHWILKLLIAGAWVLALFLLGSWLFSTQTVVLNLFEPLLATAMTLVIAIGTDISREVRRREETEFVLESVQHIAGQRLSFDRALPLIEQDIRRLLPQAQHVEVLLVDHEVSLPINPMQQTLLDKARSTQNLVAVDDRIAIPLRWQNKVQGILNIEVDTRLSRRQQQQLQQFTEQLSPSLDNIALYQDLEREKRLVDTIYADAPVGLALVDADGIIRRTNQRFRGWLNLETSSDRAFHDVLGDATDDSFERRAILEALDRGEELLINLTIGARALNIAITPLPHYAMRVVILSDTSDLVELNQLKTQMLRMASHDLKNPLSRIVGFAELMLMNAEALNPTQDKYLGYIIKSGDEMQAIIEDLLSLERLRSGTASFERINLNEMISQVTASHQPDLIRKQQLFSYEKSLEPLHVYGDTGQLSQAITNLIGNAIKYTPEGGQVSIRIQERDNQAHVEVADTGYGIPEAAQAKLFTEFFRAKSTATRHIPGTGLGLSLVKSVVERHGGKVGFHSEEGVGSTFWVNLPLVKETDHA